jgi:hypothetical protein
MRTITFMMAAIFLLFALASADWSTDPNINNPICTAADWQYDPRLVSDGSRGAIITWQDRRNGFAYDIYAQRVDANGDTLWPADGVAICTGAIDNLVPRLVGDGAGGAIIAWQSYQVSMDEPDIFAQRVDANGDTLWKLDGVPICIAEYAQRGPRACRRWLRRSHHHLAERADGDRHV